MKIPQEIIEIVSSLKAYTGSDPWAGVVEPSGRLKIELTELLADKDAYEFLVCDSAGDLWLINQLQPGAWNAVYAGRPVVIWNSAYSDISGCETWRVQDELDRLSSGLFVECYDESSPAELAFKALFKKVLEEFFADAVRQAYEREIEIERAEEIDDEL